MMIWRISEDTPKLFSSLNLKTVYNNRTNVLPYIKKQNKIKTKNALQTLEQIYLEVILMPLCKEGKLKKNPSAVKTF